jgi:Mg-chelatase subunit ChlD
VDKLRKDQSSRTTSRRELEARHEDFEQVSAEVGELDQDALAGALDEDPDRAIELLADMARATDRALRDRARALAAELLLPVARHGGDHRRRGASRLVTSARDGLDLDLDATLERAAAAGSPTGASGPSSRISADDLRWHSWERPGRAYVLLVDASGSVTGRPLATALVTAAALARRIGPDDQLAVVAFWSRAVVLRHVTSTDSATSVLDALFDLRGGDTTDLAGGLEAALAQAGRAVAGQRDVIVLTDGMANAGGDPVAVAATATATGARVHVLRLAEDPEAVAACLAVAEAGGGRVAALPRPSLAPAALSDVLT